MAPTINPEAPILLVSNTPEPTRPTGVATRVGPTVEEEPPGTVPDVRGMSAREATQRLARFGLSARIHGDGFVSSQNPPAGTPVEDGDVCHLTLTRVVAHRDTRAPE